MPDPIRILVADDHLIIRQGLRLILETEPGFELVGEAADGAEAVRLCAELHPAVVLMDLRMPGMDGLTAIERLQVEQPGIAVIILTTFNEDDLMIRGLQAGAKGYLLKDTDRETLFNSIRAAARGDTLLKPEIMARLLSKAGAEYCPGKHRVRSHRPGVGSAALGGAGGTQQGDRRPPGHQRTHGQGAPGQHIQ